MNDCKIKRALVSVYDKTGIVDFARALVDEFGIEIISTGGTAKLLTENKIPVTLVEDITGWGEMLDGRVKTLHPKIHAGILADRDNPKHMQQLADAGIAPIDMVVVNLYPFEKTVADPTCKFEEAIEMIDIGGPCMLRAAAKNHKHVIVISSQEAQQTFLNEVRKKYGIPSHLYNSFAAETFYQISMYDERITRYLDYERHKGRFAPRISLPLMSRELLRYGENPHQNAMYYDLLSDSRNAPFCSVSQSPSQMSFNNYIDATSAQELLNDLSCISNYDAPKPCCVFVKHNNACGVGVADDPIEAYRKAYLGDPKAAMGGILAVNFRVDSDFADAVMETLGRWGNDAGSSAFFLEVWLAPDFTDDSVVKGVIHERKIWGRKVRLMDTGHDDNAFNPASIDIRRIAGGLLLQERDLTGLNEGQWKTVTKRQPTDQEMNDLRLAWLVCKHTKSNAISICKDGMLIGNGAGQMSRVMSCRIATWLAKENGHADKLAGSVAASDAFFPFRDGPDILIDAGVTAIIQPGGSKRDEETIAACNERDISMIFTGTRHFKH